MNQLAHIGPAEPQHAMFTRTYQGIPGIAVSPKGRVFTLCYTGGFWEGPGNYVAVWFSDDGGETWSDTVTVIVPPQPEVRAYDSTPWLAPDGRLFIFWTQCVTEKVGQNFDGKAGVWYSCIDNPDGDPKDFHWSEPVRIADGIMMNKPIVLSDGTWALPVSVWGFSDSVQIAADPANIGTKLYASEDGGKTFYERGRFLIPEELRLFDEHSFVELKNGDILCVVRTKTGNYQAVSADGGRTWHDGQISPIPGPCSRLFITRLKSGRLLLVNNIVDPEHPKKRQKMTAWLSDDDGKTWYGELLLDGRADVSYPDGQQAADGTIWIVHDWNRTGGCEIVVSHFTEADVAAGKLVSEGSRLGIIASKSDPVPPANTLDLMAGNDNPRNSEGSFVRLKDGKVLFLYTRYTGNSSSDHASADIASCISEDCGRTWQHGGIVRSRGDADNIMSVSLLRLSNGRILLSFMEKRETQTNDPQCIPFRCFSDDEGATWSEPERITERRGYFVINNDRTIQLASGRILMPFAFHAAKGDTMLPAVASLFYSDDGGLSWQESPTTFVPPPEIKSGYQEPGVIELSPNRVMLWSRTSADYQYKAISEDGGLHFGEIVPAKEFTSPKSPLSMKRAPDGTLVAIWNNHSNREAWFIRTPLVMAKSTDNAQTWSEPEILESIPDRGYCYTAMLFADHGLLLAYCFGKNIANHMCLQDLRIRRLEESEEK